jgi:hypothetical protein
MIRLFWNSFQNLSCRTGVLRGGHFVTFSELRVGAPDGRKGFCAEHRAATLEASAGGGQRDLLRRKQLANALFRVVEHRAKLRPGV